MRNDRKATRRYILPTLSACAVVAVSAVAGLAANMGGGSSAIRAEPLAHGWMPIPVDLAPGPKVLESLPKTGDIFVATYIMGSSGRLSIAIFSASGSPKFATSVESGSTDFMGLHSVVSADGDIWLAWGTSLVRVARADTSPVVTLFGLADDGLQPSGEQIGAGEVASIAFDGATGLIGITRLFDPRLWLLDPLTMTWTASRLPDLAIPREPFTSLAFVRGEPVIGGLSDGSGGAVAAKVLDGDRLSLYPGVRQVESVGDNSFFMSTEKSQARPLVGLGASVSAGAPVAVRIPAEAKSAVSDKGTAYVTWGSDTLGAVVLVASSDGTVDLRRLPEKAAPTDVSTRLMGGLVGSTASAGLSADGLLPEDVTFAPDGTIFVVGNAGSSADEVRKSGWGSLWRYAG